MYGTIGILRPFLQKQIRPSLPLPTNITKLQILVSTPNAIPNRTIDLHTVVNTFCKPATRRENSNIYAGKTFLRACEIELGKRVNVLITDFADNSVSSAWQTHQANYPLGVLIVAAKTGLIEKC